MSKNTKESDEILEVTECARCHKKGNDVKEYIHSIINGKIIIVYEGSMCKRCINNKVQDLSETTGYEIQYRKFK